MVMQWLGHWPRMVAQERSKPAYRGDEHRPTKTIRAGELPEIMGRTSPVTGVMLIGYGYVTRAIEVDGVVCVQKSGENRILTFDASESVVVQS